MSDMLDISDLEDYLEKKKLQNNKEIENIEKRYEALKEFSEKEDVDREDIEKVMDEALCWGSLSYCCATPASGGKNCPFRDSILSKIGLDYEEFSRAKKSSEDILLSRII